MPAPLPRTRERACERFVFEERPSRIAPVRRIRSWKDTRPEPIVR